MGAAKSFRTHFSPFADLLFTIVRELDQLSSILWQLITFITFQNKDIIISSFLYAGIRFSLNGTTYRNNSIVTLENIGEKGDALLCMTNFNACCRSPYTDENMAIGNWFFPNGTTVLSMSASEAFYRTRGKMVLLLHRRRGEEEGIYHCEIPVSTDINQIIYIGVYTANSGELQNNCGV